MRRFCLRHLILIFAFCSIATSSYVLFDLLDIDGSNFKEHAQVCGFEAVMPPPCGGEIRSPATAHPAPWLGFSRGLVFSVARLTSLAPCHVPPSIPHFLTVCTRNAIQRESTSSPGGSDPARRSA